MILYKTVVNIKEVITIGDEGGMASIGLLQEYTKDFSVYICRMENYFIANTIDGLEKKELSS